MDKITVSIPVSEVPAPVQIEKPEKEVFFEVLIEETQTDQAGKEYKYTKKELTSNQQIDREIAIEDRTIADATKRKEKLTAKKTAIINANNMQIGQISEIAKI